jgi:hypothetical protein
VVPFVLQLEASRAEWCSRHGFSDAKSLDLSIVLTHFSGAVSGSL